MPSGAEFIKQVKAEIDEVDPSEVRARSMRQRRRDRRRPRERRVGRRATCPAPSTSPRGHLESRIEGAAPDHSQRVILYCASGNRSALAAKTHARGARLRARRVDDRRLHAVEGPRLRGRGPAHADRRAARALQPPPPRCPRSASRASMKLLDAKVLLPRRRRPRLADRALPRRGRRRHARHRRRRRRRPLQPPAPGHPHDRRHRHPEGRLGRAAIKDLNPDVNVVKYQTRLDASNIMEIIEGYDIDRRRRRQLPDALPAQRRVGAAEDPGRQRRDPRLRGPAQRLRPLRRPVLPLPVPGRRRRPSSRRAAAPTASSACCRARWACCRRPRSSSSSPARATRSSAACSCTTRSTRRRPS